MVNGIDKAAASDTTPRIPAHAEISGDFHPGLGSATVIKRLATLVKRAAPNVQRNLAIIRLKWPKRTGIEQSSKNMEGKRAIFNVI